MVSSCPLRGEVGGEPSENLSPPFLLPPLPSLCPKFILDKLFPRFADSVSGSAAATCTVGRFEKLPPTCRTLEKVPLRCAISQSSASLTSSLTHASSAPLLEEGDGKGRGEGAGVVRREGQWMDSKKGWALRESAPGRFNGSMSCATMGRERGKGLLSSF